MALSFVVRSQAAVMMLSVDRLQLKVDMMQLERCIWYSTEYL